MTGPYEYLDACPECGERDCRPDDPTLSGGQMVAGYCCLRCGHTWSASWVPQNGEQETPAEVPVVGQRRAVESQRVDERSRKAPR